MIDWSKDIETTDGLSAYVLANNIEQMWICVCVKPDPDSCGSRADVFLVDHEGFRCDDRALFSARQEPFIRNVRVKREGWVNIYAVYKTEVEAKRACVDLDRNCHRFVKWEE
jgi:hypothetical protein